MESATALERAVVLDMIVAWRALMLCRLGKKQPALGRAKVTDIPDPNWWVKD